MIKESDNVEHFVGLDIGSYSCKASIARVCSWENLDLEILSVSEQISGNSVERGCIVNIENASDVVENVLDKLYKKASKNPDTKNVGIDNVQDVPKKQNNDIALHGIYGALSVKDKYLSSRINNARYPFSKSPIEINVEHLHKARDMASNYPLENGRDYLHIMTRNYRVDNRLPKRNPEGELGMAVDAEVFLLSASKQELVNTQKCVSRAHFPLEYICAGPIAAAEGILTRVEKEQSTMLVDIGAETSSAVLFDSGVPKVLSTVPFGSRDVTRDLSQMLHIPEGLAETLKKTCACVDELYFSQFPKTIVLKDDEYDQTFSIEAQKIYQITHARMYEIFKILYTSMNLINSAHAYPVVITGGGARILGCAQMAEKLTGVKTRLAQPWNWGGPFTDYRMPNFSTSIGLCVVAAQHYATKRNSVHSNQTYKQVPMQLSPVKAAFQNFGVKVKDFFSFGDIE